jgi:hypothetical protein
MANPKSRKRKRPNSISADLQVLWSCLANTRFVRVQFAVNRVFIDVRLAESGWPE